jgi:hypothetical protein
MKTFILIIVALLIQQEAFAAIGSCRNRIDLVCEAKFNRPDGSSDAGPAAVSRVHNQDHALFAPVDCQSSVVIDTYAGKFTANYNDYSGTISAWFENTEGRKSLLILADTIDLDNKASVTVPNLADERYDSITFTCSTRVNAQFRYRYNPAE